MQRRSVWDVLGDASTSDDLLHPSLPSPLPPRPHPFRGAQLAPNPALSTQLPPASARGNMPKSFFFPNSVVNTWGSYGSSKRPGC